MLGNIGPMELFIILVIVLISETVSNAMQGGADTITDGLLLAAVVVGWATFIDFLDYKLPSWRIASAGPLELVRDGKLVAKNLAREHVTEDEVMTQLRHHGLASAKDVAVAYLEGDGHLSVILKSGTPLKSRGHH